MHRAAALNLFLRLGRMLEIDIYALLDVRHFKNVVNAVTSAVINEVHHQLVVGNAKGVEAPETRAGVMRKESKSQPLGRGHLPENWAASALSTASIISSLMAANWPAP